MHAECFEIQTVTATWDVLPKRLLDLRFVAQQGSISLITSRSLPQDTIYATLSHCWGGGCQKTLTVDSLEEFETGLLVDSIPKTFRDAVFVSIELGIKYLWIDALCIVQDSVDNLEWRQEASIMGDVYANSYVTLAATTSSNPQGGLVHQRNPLSVWPCRLTATWRCFVPGELVVSTGVLSRDSDMRPLGNRAWAFQEWLLSRRLIHFSNDQVRWECYCLAASEVYPDGLDETDLQDQGTPTKGIVVDLWADSEASHLLWKRIREEYSEKALTKTTDKLAAFSGIARMVHKLLKSSKEDYLAGLWKQNLLQELLWERYKGVGEPHDPNLYIAPTWSWASLNGSFWNTDLESEIKKSSWHVNVFDTKISYVDDAFGPVKSGSLILQCSLCYITLSSPHDRPSDTNSSSSHSWKTLTINGVSVAYGCNVSFDHLSLATLTPCTSLSFYFIPVRSFLDQKSHYPDNVTGLLLQKTQKVRGQYCRVGLLKVYLFGTDQSTIFSHLERKDYLGATYYLDTASDDLCAIEIV